MPAPTAARGSTLKCERTELTRILRESVPSFDLEIQTPLEGAAPLLSAAAIVRPYDLFGPTEKLPSNRQHRAVRLHHHFVRNRSRHMAGQALPRLRSHHDQVRIRLAGHGENLFRRFAEGGPVLRLAPVLRSLGHKLLQLFNGE